jgi:hypothetical protein
MSPTPTVVQNNAFMPGISAETYIPDQLIAGAQKLVIQPIVLAAGSQLPRGTVLGRQTSYSVLVAPGSANVGNGALASVSAVGGALVGAYSVVATSSTTWTVTNPEGTALANATTGTAYTGGGLKFTISAGGTAFAAGDTFTLTVVDSIGNFIVSVKSASDGSQNPMAILADYADATNAPVKTAAYLMGEFNINSLYADASWTPETLTTAMRPYGFNLKTTMTAQDPGSVTATFA